MKIERVTKVPPMTKLLAESKHQGFRFLERLINDFESGANRFEEPGEALFAVFIDSLCVGIGGVNRDPSGNPGLGRVRRVYVSIEHQGNGIGRVLMESIESWSKDHFDALSLFTDTQAASRFYESLGYHSVGEDKTSHFKKLTKTHSET